MHLTLKRVILNVTLKPDTGIWHLAPGTWHLAPGTWHPQHCDVAHFIATESRVGPVRRRGGGGGGGWKENKANKANEDDKDNNNNNNNNNRLVDCFVE